MSKIKLLYKKLDRFLSSVTQMQWIGAGMYLFVLSSPFYVLSLYVTSYVPVYVFGVFMLLASMCFIASTSK